MTLLDATDVVKTYESGQTTLRALDGVSLSVEAGEFVAIVGPSGSGKSTLMNLLGLLDTPTSGRITVDGTPLSSLSVRERTDRRRETVGFVFQDFHLVPTLSARENVALPGAVRADRAAVHDRARSLLARVGLGDRLDHQPAELSGGQKQRVAVARSLVNDPSVLLADEPTGNLDRETGAAVLDVFHDVTDEGVAVVTVTHDDAVAAEADRTVELVDGRLQGVAR